MTYLATLDLAIDRLRPYPGNPRRGDLPVIEQSLKTNAQYRAVVVRADDPADPLAGGVILAGNHTWMAARNIGMSTIRAELHDVDDQTAARIVAVDNRAADLGDYDERLLAELLSGIDDLTGSGYDADDLADLAGLLDVAAPESMNDPDALPDLAAEDTPAVSRPGDLWQLGPHRLLCADTTDPAAVARLVDGTTVTMLHADPPYGMGKEADGVRNDNLYRGELDAFQMQWWKAWTGALAGNGSVYVWGNAPDLWRLWWTGGIDHADFLVRNEIVWDKGSVPGMRSALEHSYPTATERCLFLMRGQQFLGNLNKDDFWEGYEPLRAWLDAERSRAGWTAKDVNRLTGTQMAGHWFTRSQFHPIPERHYRVLQEAAAGRAFVTHYDDLFTDLFPGVHMGGNQHRRELGALLRESRTYFDNTHDVMTDVWAYSRVVGEERYGHATPKPVAMVERAITTSSRRGDVVGVPFGGTGPEFIAAHRLGRVAVGIEIEPRYVDVICRRYQEHTGDKPTREGAPRDFLAAP